MGDIEIRQATSDDLERLLQLEQAIIEAERPFDKAIRIGGDVRYYDLEQMITSPDVELVVATIDDEVIGCGYARIEASKPYLTHDRHSYLGFMYVVPEHRGEGINGLIIEALELWSLSRGVSYMTLEVYLDNASAVRAYERAGYKRAVIQMNKVLGDGKSNVE